MHNLPPELLKEAFIDPIRFALVLDDEFPTYSQMSRQESASHLDYTKAGSLFSFCRSKGWLCDIDNAVIFAEEFERDKHLNQSDLLILDFHLETDKPNNPRKALGVLQSLASSNHFNLVILYTAANPADVARDIAFSLGAGCILDEEEKRAVVDFLEELEDQDLRELKDLCNVDIVQNFLQSKMPNGSAAALRKVLSNKDVRGPFANNVINYFCEEYLLEVVPEDVHDSRNFGSKVEACFSADSPMWVAKGNLFTVVVNKQEPVEVLVDRLQEALNSWSPSPLRVLMVHARAALEKVGTNADIKVLDTPRRQAGWLLRILSATSIEDRKRHTQDLYGRLFERLIKHVDNSAFEFGTRLFPQSDRPAVDIASEMAVATGISKEWIYHALNEHLCSDSYSEGAITTGVVFKSVKDGLTNYWLCATPACDLVPGQNTGGWDGELAPFRPITAVRLISVTSSMRKRLEDATQGRYIFVFLNETPLVLQVTDEDTRKMKLETIFLRENGNIHNSKFSGFCIGKGDGGIPTMLERNFESIALLRSDYANKFLAESGYQRARIGVDFVDYPKE
ncbi:response regulator receiver domain [Pseudomonas sp. AIG]